MAMTQSQRLGIFSVLALVMAATRLHHFDAIPDASWGVFFLGGFWLRGSARWAFPLLMAEAVLVDFFAITSQGLSFWSHYCVSPGYWFLVPSYFALWLGGSWLARHQAGVRASTLGLAALALLVSEAVCYSLSNASFYWLSPTTAAAPADPPCPRTISRNPPFPQAPRALQTPSNSTNP